jgi:hypothetical protein
MRALITVCALLALVACRAPNEPPTPFPTGARTRLIVQKQFKLGNMDFGDGELSSAIPAMLLTEIAAGGRFSVYEGGGIRGRKNAAITESSAQKYTDGYLSGTVTSKSPTDACVDVRLSNSFNHEVLFAKETCLTLEAGESVMKPDREAMKRLADEISRTIKEVGNAYITSVDGRLIFIDVVKEKGLIAGMVGYVVSTGSSIDDKKIHESVANFSGVDPSRIVAASTPIVVGEVVIVQVEEKFAVAELYRGDYALPGDTVFFK